MTQMLVVNQTEKVKEQYQKADNLNIRIALHNKYSKNKMGFGNWHFTIYQIETGMKVLELGCGTGSMWIGHEDIMKRCSKLVLSDLSEGMLESAKQNLEEASNIEYKKIDIQDIPFADETFDVVIANCMLYHVPDLKKALSEVQRVLKTGGYFYTSTGGENGIMEKVVSLLEMDYQYTYPFSLQNGAEKLKPFFTTVEMFKYEDSLEVTNVDDLVQYVFSGITFPKVCTIPQDRVKEIFEKNMVEGVLTFPKEQGMFVAKK